MMGKREGGGGGGEVGRYLHKKKQYKLFTLGTVKCFRELNIHRFNANTPPPPSPPQMTCILGRVKKANNEKYKINYGSTHKSCHHVIYLVRTWVTATEIEDKRETKENKVGSNLHMKLVVFVLLERINRVEPHSEA